MRFSTASLHDTLAARVPLGATGLVAAVSGGRDSAALLTALASLPGGFRQLPLRAVHVDHGLQAAAAAFAEACAHLCRRLGVPLTVIAANVRTAGGESIESAAREARYAALGEELRPGECLLTAHHLEDQAQTLLLQALRGSGLPGLSAMPACAPLGSGWHVRPVLEVPQDELIASGGDAGDAGDARGLDPMNSDPRFDRVYVRRALWPPIEARWPGAGAALARSARHAADAQALLDRGAAADVARLRDGEALSVPGLRALDSRRRLNAVRYWLAEKSVEPPSTARIHEALRQVLDAQADHLPAVVWRDVALRRYRQRLFLTPAEPPRMHAVFHWSVAIGARVELGPQLGALRWIAQVGGLSAADLPASVIVRRRGGGETLRPAARARTASVQHLCQSAGVLPWLRDALPYVYAGAELIAVADLWMNAHRSATAGARAARGADETPAPRGMGIVWENAPIVV